MSQTRRTTLAAALAMAAAAPAVAQAAGPVQPLYLFLYRAGPAWQADKPMEAQGLGPHAVFIKRLLDEGRLVAGGPLLDTIGGMAIVRAAGYAEARAIFDADPALTSGIFAGEMHSWAPRFDSGEPLRKPKA